MVQFQIITDGKKFKVQYKYGWLSSWEDLHDTQYDTLEQAQEIRDHWKAYYEYDEEAEKERWSVVNEKEIR